MSRSNRDKRPHQKVDGGGLVNESAMGAGVGVAPRGENMGSGMARMMERTARAQTGGAPEPQQMALPESGSGGQDSGIGEMGNAISSMFTESKKRKTAKTLAEKSKIILPRGGRGGIR